MKDYIEQKFQELLKATYSSHMITREQQTDVRLAFLSGAIVGLRLTITARSPEEVDKLTDVITELFNETNNNR